MRCPMLSNRSLLEKMLKPILGLVFMALLLAGCGSDPSKDPPPKTESTTALKGTFQIPDGINSPGSSPSKALTLAKSIPFTGATFVAISMEDGKEYPQKDA